MSIKKRVVRLAFVVTLFVCSTFAVHAAPPAGSQTAPKQSKVQWEKNINTAHAASIKTGKPILVLFGAKWCRYCHKLEQETVNHPEMVRYINNNFVPLHLDLDRDSKLAIILEVKSIPCTLILSPEADLLGKHVGYDKPASYYAKLSAARKLQDKVQQVKYQTN